MIEKSDDNPFVKYLTNDEDYYPEFIQTGIDILHRLKKNKQIIKYFLSIGKVKIWMKRIIY